MINIETANHEELCDVINSDLDLIDWWIKKDFVIPEEMDINTLRSALTMRVEEGDETFVF